MNERLHAAGGEVIAISVDDEERQAAMFARWPMPNVLFVSDPGGETYLKALDLYDPVERDGIALPAMLVFDPDGREVFGYRGRDFADRTHDDDVIEALEAMELGPLDPPPGGPVAVVDPEAQRGAFQPRMMSPYFRGSRSGVLALQLRADGEEAISLAREHRGMCDSILAAWDEVKQQVKPHVKQQVEQR